MNLVAELLQLTIPAGLVLLGMYLAIKAMLERDFRKQQQEIRHQYSETVIPIRLQAYERMTLFLERISPNNLLLRMGGQELTALDLQQLLLREIRDEYNHNLSQQVYMSQASWDQIVQAMNEVVALINQAASEVMPDAPALDLSKKIFEQVIQQNNQPVALALKVIKEEIQQTFL
ncbi:DUF7935 family protein [Tellurirhabdus bombi]|uniref:DUF7935 family protein n=1 Tax=Tellurirhabdus bombi TaxID=2907205 RepID=UPI001F3E7B71|nr:hypothetical protein [Tellurirhabdus bombi]